MNYRKRGLWIDGQMFFEPFELTSAYPFFLQFFHQINLRHDGYWLVGKMNEYLGEEAQSPDENIPGEIFQQLYDKGKERGDA